MTTPNTAAPSVPSQGNGKKPGFRKDEYGLTLFVLFCAFLATLIAACILPPTPVFKLAGVAATTLTYTLVFVLVNAIFKPSYIAKFPVKPNDATRALVIFGFVVLAVRHILRQTELVDQLQVLLIALVVGLVIWGLMELVFTGAKRLPPEIPPETISLCVSTVGFLAAILLVPTVFSAQTREQQALLQIDFVLWLALWIQILSVLAVLNKPNFKREFIDEGHAAVIMKEKRIQSVVVDKPVAEVALKGETVVMIDLRVRKLSVMHECESADHVKVRLHAICQWRVRSQEAQIRKFLINAQEPEKVLPSRLRAAISAEIGQRASDMLIDRQSRIGGSLRARMMDTAAALGMQIVAVHVIDLHTRFPSMAEGGAPSIEAERMRRIDPTVRQVSTQTINHLQKVWESQAYGDGSHDNAKR